MDSLDELLADLRSTTAYMKKEQRKDNSFDNSNNPYSMQKNYNVSPTNYYKLNNEIPGYPPKGQTANYRPSSASSDRRYSNGSTSSGDYPGPPLPPPPTHETIHQFYDESIYEPQNISYGRSQINDKTSPYPVQGQATLGANLNELDSLLQDLNSAKYVQQASRNSSENSIKGQPSVTTSIIKTKPKHMQQFSPKASVSFNMTPNDRSTNRQSLEDASSPGSSATKELDDLMESLSQFKLNANIQQTPPKVDEPAYALINKTPSTSPTGVTPKPNELDSMLGSLDADMKGKGITLSAKGVCGACSKAVIGQVITALGKIWHVEHFCCQGCHEELGTRNFFERDEMPYCEACYHQLFAPLCEKCKVPILDKIVTAMDSTWHVDCFVCNHCSRPLNDEAFHEKDGLPYCKEDYFEIFAPKCCGCNYPIIDDFISTLNTQWHKKCFRCMECNVNLAGGSFYDHDGLPYCETHYYAKRGSLCAGCQKPITGRCITAMARKFHPEHFVCAFCLKQLNKGTFKEHNDKPYCHPCFVKLFG